jgi:hypothetical protein
MSFVRFEQSVLPMVSAADDGHPRRTGSCVLVRYGSRPFVVTAKHTLENNPLAIHVGRRGAKLIPLPVGGFYTTDAYDALDIAVVPLTPEQQSMLQEQNLVFIRETRFELGIDAPEEPAPGNDYVVFGWPESKSQSRIDRPRRKIKQNSFTLQTGRAKPESAVRADVDLSSHLVLEFDPEQITVQGKRHNPPRPHGVSGGAAFHVVGADVKLAEIMTAFHRDPPRVMIAVRMGEVVAILEHVLSQS